MLTSAGLAFVLPFVVVGITLAIWAIVGISIFALDKIRYRVVRLGGYSFKLNRR